MHDLKLLVLEFSTLYSSSLWRTDTIATMGAGMESGHCRKVAVNERARGYCTCNRNSLRKGECRAD